MKVRVLVEDGERLKRAEDIEFEELPDPLKEVLVTNALAIVEVAEDGEVNAAVLDVDAADFRIVNLGRLGLPRKLRKISHKSGVAYLVFERSKYLA